MSELTPTYNKPLFFIPSHSIKKTIKNSLLYVISFWPHFVLVFSALILFIPIYLAIVTASQDSVSYIHQHVTLLCLEMP